MRVVILLVTCLIAACGEDSATREDIRFRYVNSGPPDTVAADRMRLSFLDCRGPTMVYRRMVAPGEGGIARFPRRDGAMFQMMVEGFDACEREHCVPESPKTRGQCTCFEDADFPAGKLVSDGCGTWSSGFDGNLPLGLSALPADYDFKRCPAPAPERIAALPDCQ